VDDAFIKDWTSHLLQKAQYSHSRLNPCVFISEAQSIGNIGFCKSQDLVCDVTPFSELRVFWRPKNLHPRRRSHIHGRSEEQMPSLVHLVGKFQT
jgi:hypothetical protein